MTRAARREGISRKSLLSMGAAERTGSGRPQDVARVVVIHIRTWRPHVGSTVTRGIPVHNNRPLVNSVRPSADVLFQSVAESYNGRKLAVVLTGMGEDGKKGVADLKTRNCFCITQTSETCVVYGMPRAVDEAGLSDESLDPLDITQKIVFMAQ